MANQIYDSIIPLVPSGTPLNITVSQTLEQKLLSTTPNPAPPVKVQIDGPRTMLTPDDIVGEYPAPGSTNSPGNYVPHIALARRTLPWERPGPDGGTASGAPQIPWLAMLLVTQAELRAKKAPGTTLDTATVVQLKNSEPLVYSQLHPIGDDQSVTVVTLPNDLLSKLLPSEGDMNELALLCHVKGSDDATKRVGNPIVVGSRLPEIPHDGSPPQIHTAMLVSLENRTDLYGAGGRLKQSGNTTLVVLHYWSFTPSNGADFMEVLLKIGIYPNGGVLRYGNLARWVRGVAPGPLSANFAAALDPDGYQTSPLDDSHLTTLPAALKKNVIWRGPLRPFPTPPESHGVAVRSAPEEFDPDPAKPNDPTPLDYSHATAFELGRLLALADPGIREDLNAVRVSWKIPKDIVATSVIPAALQMPQWLVDPPDSLDNQWAFAPNLFQNGLANATMPKADLTGIADPVAKQNWQGTVAGQLGQAAGLSVITSSLVIDTEKEAGLAVRFSALINAAK